MALADLLLPRHCVGCAGPAEQVLCPDCLAAAGRLRLEGQGRELLDTGVLAVGAFAYDGVIADAIRRVKVLGWHDAVAGLGTLLRDTVALPAAPTTWVPSTPGRLRERGVDVPQLLAGPAAVPMLRRLRQGRDQTELGPDARRAALVGVFVATGPVPRTAVVVDDVRTTGATARAVAAALQAAGARRVLVATLAVAGTDGRTAAVGSTAGRWTPPLTVR